MRSLSANVPWAVGFGRLQIQKGGLQSGQGFGLMVEVPEKQREKKVEDEAREHGHVRMVRREMHAGASKESPEI